MTQFANYKNGQVSINTYRDCNAMATDIADVLHAVEHNTSEVLTASIDNDHDLYLITQISN